MTYQEFCKQHRITIDVEWTEKNPCMSEKDNKKMYHYKCTLRRKTDEGQPRQFTLIFSQGYGINHEPRPHDLITCIALDSSDEDYTFEEWAREYGYDEDSRTAERVYNAVLDQTKKGKAFLGEIWDELMECEE
jgi:hypothetical protein